MKTVLEILKLTTDYLKEKGVGNARREAEDLISDALGLTRMQLYTDFERPLTNQELVLCRERLQRRIKGEPLQYIHGEVEFFGCRIKVTPAVLIPRQETEILVDKIAKELSQVELDGKVLWDLCCGSGCIGIALKKKFPQLEVCLSDISQDALNVASENAKLNEVSVTLLHGDLFQPFVGKKTHYIVCNPPYIAESEFQALDREVREHEPRQALISGKSGLEFYERLASEISGYLLPSGKAWFEIGTGQGEAVRQLFGEQHCRVEKDWSNHDRFVFYTQT